MVNPREDEPLHFLQIDPETGAISERSLDSETIQRGQYTITVLKLNERPDLDRQRQHLYFDILDWISEMVKW
jgi:hypothetical protein